MELLGNRVDTDREKHCYQHSRAGHEPAIHIEHRCELCFYCEHLGEAHHVRVEGHSLSYPLGRVDREGPGLLIGAPAIRFKAGISGYKSDVGTVP
jgi:hypothetical protein